MQNSESDQLSRKFYYFPTEPTSLCLSPPSNLIHQVGEWGNPSPTAGQPIQRYTFPRSFDPCGELPSFLTYYTFSVPPIVHVHGERVHIGTFFPASPTPSDSKQLGFVKFIFLMGGYMMGDLGWELYEEVDAYVRNEVARAFKQRVLDKSDATRETPCAEWDRYLSQRGGGGEPNMPKCRELFMGMHWVWAYEDWGNYGVLRVSEQ